MKSNSKLSEKENSKAEDIEYTNLGVTNRLLKKYKPQEPYNIETRMIMNNKRRVA